MQQQISRGGQDAGKLAYRFAGPVAVGAQLTVARSEKVAVVSAGATLGVLEEGSHRLDPQALPFLGICVQGETLDAELYFVANGLYNVRFGGQLRAIFDSQTGERKAPRCFGSYSLGVTDLRRLLAMGLLGQSDQGDGWLKSGIFDALSQALAQAGTAVDLTNPGVLAGIAERARSVVAGRFPEYGLTLEGLSLLGINLAPA